jgi:hypothetical protein
MKIMSESQDQGVESRAVAAVETGQRPVFDFHLSPCPAIGTEP